MDIILKQRLIGAIVLISLGVIFLPMLFTGNGQFESRFKSNIPQEPSYEIVSPQVPVPEQIPSRAMEKVPLIEPIDASANRPDKPETTHTQEKPQQQAAAKVPHSRVAKAEPITKAKTQTSPKKSTVTGWVVQVGSFYKKNNAITLRDKLRKAGLPSFLVTAKGKNGPIYRVRVGPERDQKQAKKVLRQIERDTKLKGIILRYP